LLHVSNLHIGLFHDPWQNDAKGTRQRHTHKSAFTFKHGAGFMICIQLDVASLPKDAKRKGIEKDKNS
jgi:hypothetical protein